MNIAFCLSTFQPFSGMARDFFNIAQACAQHHTIYVFTRAWHGDIPSWLSLPNSLCLLSNSCKTNHCSMLKFANDCQKKIASFPIKFDRIIGFNKMPGLDFYYAADTCFIAKHRYQKFSPLRFSKRYKVYSALERSVFMPQHSTKIIALSQQTMDQYISCYHTPAQRFYVLPPNVASDRRLDHTNDALIRLKMRKKFSIAEENFLILSIGSNYHTKGVDRSLRAFAALPSFLKNKSQFLIVGAEKNIKKYKKLAEKLKINQFTVFLGAREDIVNLLAATDVLLHPARQEAAGLVIAEALLARVPILVTGNCGYASLVQAADAGKIIAQPFQQKNMNLLFKELLDKNLLDCYRQHAKSYTETHNFYGMKEAIALITNSSP